MTKHLMTGAEITGGADVRPAVEPAPDLRDIINRRLAEMLCKELNYNFEADRINRIAQIMRELMAAGYPASNAVSEALDLELLLYGDPHAPADTIKGFVPQAQPDRNFRADSLSPVPVESLDDTFPTPAALDVLINRIYCAWQTRRMTPDAIARALFSHDDRATLLTNPKFENAIDAAPALSRTGERIFGIPFETRTWMPPGKAALVSQCNCPDASEENHFIKRHVVIITGLET